MSHLELVPHNETEHPRLAHGTEEEAVFARKLYILRLPGRARTTFPSVNLQLVEDTLQ